MKIDILSVAHINSAILIWSNILYYFKNYMSWGSPIVRVAGNADLSLVSITCLKTRFPAIRRHRGSGSWQSQFWSLLAKQYSFLTFQQRMAHCQILCCWLHSIQEPKAMTAPASQHELWTLPLALCLRDDASPWLLWKAICALFRWLPLRSTKWWGNRTFLGG